MSEEVEVIPQSKKSIFMNFYLTLRIEIGEDPSVLSQQTVNIPYEVI
jgi:hypothetical protein